MLHHVLLGTHNHFPLLWGLHDLRNSHIGITQFYRGFLEWNFLLNLVLWTDKLRLIWIQRSKVFFNKSLRLVYGNIWLIRPIRGLWVLQVIVVEFYFDLGLEEFLLILIRLNLSWCLKFALIRVIKFRSRLIRDENLLDIVWWFGFITLDDGWAKILIFLFFVDWTQVIFVTQGDTIIALAGLHNFSIMIFGRYQVNLWPSKIEHYFCFRNRLNLVINLMIANRHVLFTIFKTLSLGRWQILIRVRLGLRFWRGCLGVDRIDRNYNSLFDWLLNVIGRFECIIPVLNSGGSFDFDLIWR